jgi:hypothetical protein
MGFFIEAMDFPRYQGTSAGLRSGHKFPAVSVV